MYGRAFGGVTVVVVAGVVGCPSASPAPQGPSPEPSTSSVSSVVPKPVPVPSTSASNEVPIVLPPNAAVPAPVFSDDDCSADADCAPLATCHPARCVATANAGSLPSGTMCTMDCRGGTLDCGYNHCGCAASPSGKKKCAMLPGPASGH